ncbi:MAG: phosphoglycerate kinase [Acidobacteriota bacterium]
MNRYLSVRDLPVLDRKVLVRVDLNVPLREGLIQDETRITSVLPTLTSILDRGGAVIACSHLGRPKGTVVPALSLGPVARRLAELLPERTVLAAGDVVGPDARAKAAGLKPGQLLLLENVRFEPGETKGDEAFAKALRSLADLYVNDAFGSCHRAHVSVHGVAKLFPQAAAGLLLERELQYLEGRLNDPERPYAAFLGGAKVSDKVPILERLLDRVDSLCVGGAMALNFLAAQGHPTGRSFVEPDLAPVCKAILTRAGEKKVDLLLPVDHVAATALEAEEAEVVDADALPEGLAAFDIGPRTIRRFSDVALASRTLFWNGPMGVFERPLFSAGTLELAKAVAASEGVSVIGGGDSVSAVHAAGVASSIDHISTGGGASLALVAGEKLPGLEFLSRL